MSLKNTAECEARFPGFIAEQLKANVGFIRSHVIANFRATIASHGLEEVLHEATVGAAIGIASWKLAEQPSGNIQGYMKMALKFHIIHVMKGKSGPITHTFQVKNKEGGNLPLCDRVIRLKVASIDQVGEIEARQVERELDARDEIDNQVGEIFAVAREVDQTGITSWILRQMMGGKTYQEIGGMIGVTKQRIGEVIVKIRDAVKGEFRTNSWSRETVSRFSQLTA